MVSTISLFIVLLVTSAQALRRDSSWTITLTPADSGQNIEYEGEVEVLAVFADGKQHSITLPSTKYEKARPVAFPVVFTSPGPLEMVYLRTRGVCPIGLLPLTVLRLRQIELESHDSNTTYTKFVDDLAIKDACQSKKSLGTALKDFDSFNPRFCVVDGKKYADGEEFDMGCTARCSCREGRYGCVDMCPPTAWSPDSKCHFVHVPGQCCDAVRCEAEEQLNSCDAPAKTETEKGTGKGRPPVRRYPWSVLLCTDSKCTQVYGGVIVGSRHILSFAPDLSSYSDLRFTVGQYIAGGSNSSEEFSPLRIVNITAHPDFVNPDSPIADSGSRLQLLEVDQMFTFDKTVQPANLPFNKKQCSQLSKENCDLMAVGWDRTDEADAEFRQWFVHSEKTVPDRDACGGDSPTGSPNPKMIRGPRLRGDSRVCVSGLSRTDCTGPLGGAVVSTRGQVDFLVGILDPDSALFFCENQGTASMLPLCKYSDWIVSTTTAGNF